MQSAGSKPQTSRPQIADAWLEPDRLVVLSAEFERMSVPLEKLAPLLGGDREAVRSFEIDEDGSFLYWPHADAHLGWDQLLGLIDPTATLVARQRKSDFNRRYGGAIRAMREASGLTQAGASGVTDRHLRRVESGELPATRATLEALAAAHGLSLEELPERGGEARGALTCSGVVRGVETVVLTAGASAPEFPVRQCVQRG